MSVHCTARADPFKCKKGHVIILNVYNGAPTPKVRMNNWCAHCNLPKFKSSVHIANERERDSLSNVWARRDTNVANNFNDIAFEMDGCSVKICMS